jgi:electron transfer flavoprotein alpha subunit
MDTLLALLHTEADGSLAKPAMETLASAVETASALGGAPLAVGIVGHGAKAAAGTVASCGAKRFLAAEGADLKTPRYGSDAAAAEAVAKASGASIILAPATSRWCRVMSGVAHRLDGRPDAHVTALKADAGKLSVTRWYYRQRFEAVLSRAERPWVILLDPGCHAPWEGAAGTASVEDVAVSVPDDARRTTVTGVAAPPAAEQTIRPDARLLFVAGAGWTKKQPDGQTHAPEAEALVLSFITKTQASLGGSKSIVDMSGEGQPAFRFMTHMNQVGQTGATPRHPKGLATCCHGEEPHVVGWRFVNDRRAVNLDPACGWAQGKADVLYVADAFAVIRKVNELLKG